MKPSLVSALAIIVLLTPVSAQAVRQYRCNGMVQYRPCEPGTASAGVLDASQAVDPSRADARARYRSGPGFARLLSSDYEFNSRAKEGVWSGWIEGTGHIHLKLYIFVQGNLVDTRYMGSTVLANQKSSFKFCSVPPKQREWSWRIVATAQQSS